MYTVLTTCPPRGGSENVGDKLIEHSLKELVAHSKGDVEFQTFFREDRLDEHLDVINRSRAILLPGFAIRDTPMYPKTYRLADDLKALRVPLIPIGANWNVYPGDHQSRRAIRYSDQTAAFLRHVASQVGHLSCREYYVCQILKAHGVRNTLMTGDPAWFDLASLGKRMKRPARVERLVFTPPLSPYYIEQAEGIMRMLAALFPGALKICSMHLADRDTVSGTPNPENSAAVTPEVTQKNRRVRAVAAELGFEARQVSGDVRRIDFYSECDLHVGYECHAHFGFLRKRIPSVLITEDARGVGFVYTIGMGGFDGFVRCQLPAEDVERKSHTSGYCTTLREYSIAPARVNLAETMRQFIEEELDSGFRRYIGVADYLDDLYESVMAPFIRSLP